MADNDDFKKVEFEYLIDEDDVVYDKTSEEAIGIYNCKKKEWIMRD